MCTLYLRSTTSAGGKYPWNDIDFFPLVLSYGIITMDSFELYIDERKLDDKLKAKLAKRWRKLTPIQRHLRRREEI